MSDQDTTASEEAPNADINVAPARPEAKGQFAQALTASNRQIQRTRALQLTETTRMLYRRRVEDLVSEHRQLMLAAQGQLDLRGDNALSLNPASKDFDAGTWVDANIAARMGIRNNLQKLAVAYFGYSQLFGEDTALVSGIDIRSVELSRIDIPLID